MNATTERAKELLRECLAAKLPAALRVQVDEFLARPQGRPRKADPARIAALRAEGLTDAAISRELGCDPAAVRRVPRDNGH